MAHRKQASVSADGAPINRRDPRIVDLTSSEEVEEEAEEEAGAEEEAERTDINQIPDEGLDEEETIPIPPNDMFFPRTEYKKCIKIETRYLFNTLKTLINVLTKKELKWFEEHPQFKHFFHMPELRNHKSMGMWMLVPSFLIMTLSLFLFLVNK